MSNERPTAQLSLQGSRQQKKIIASNGSSFRKSTKQSF